MYSVIKVLCACRKPFKLQLKNLFKARSRIFTLWPMARVNNYVSNSIVLDELALGGFERSATTTKSVNK